MNNRIRLCSKTRNAKVVAKGNVKGNSTENLMRLIRQLKKLRGKKCFITFHTHGDIDSVCSAYLMTKILKRAEIFSFDNVTSSARRVCGLIGINIRKYDEIKDKLTNAGAAVPIIVVDTQSKEMLQGKDMLQGLESANIVIDHHSYTEKIVNSEYLLLDASSYSTTQIIYGLFKKMKVRIGPQSASCILLGIIDDTMRFREGDRRLFSTIGELLSKSFLSYSEMLDISRDSPLNNRINALKACGDASYTAVNGKLIIAARAPSNEGSATTLLSNFGDVVFVGAMHEGEMRISARSSVKGLDLRQIAREVGKELGIKVGFGGHPYALGMRIHSTDEKLLKDALKRCIGKTKGFLKHI